MKKQEKTGTTCEYCKPGMWWIVDQVSEGVLQIDGQRLKITYDAECDDDSFASGVHIKYCPMCGRKL